MIGLEQSCRHGGANGDARRHIDLNLTDRDQLEKKSLNKSALLKVAVCSDMSVRGL